MTNLPVIHRTVSDELAKFGYTSYFVGSGAEIRYVVNGKLVPANDTCLLATLLSDSVPARYVSSNPESGKANIIYNGK